MAVLDRITIPNPFNDTRDTLNAGGGSVNNNLGTAFLAGAKINPWSKHKPVILPVSHCQDFDPNSPNYYPNWWKGVNGNCGLTPKELSSYKNLPDVMDGGMNGWVYNLPQGGENQPLRQGDFINYKYDCIPPVGGFECPKQAINKFSSSYFDCSFRINYLQNDYALSIYDIGNLQDYYPGVWCRSGDYNIRVTAENPLKAGGSTVRVNSHGMVARDWEVYPFLAENPIKQNDPESMNSYYSLPNLEMRTIKILNTDVIVTIYATIYKSPYRAEYNVRINNISDSSKTFTNNFVKLRWKDKNFNDPLTLGESQKAITSPITVLAKESKIVAEGTILMLDSNMYPNDCRVWVSLNSGGYLDSVLPLIGDFS